MTGKQDSDKVSERLNRQIRQAKHGKGYYISLYLLCFAIPLYVLLQFFYVYAGGWTLLDAVLILVLLAIAVNGLYVEFASKTKLPFWFTVLGVIAGIIVLLLQIIL